MIIYKRAQSGTKFDMTTPEGIRASYDAWRTEQDVKKFSNTLNQSARGYVGQDTTIMPNARQSEEQRLNDPYFKAQNFVTGSVLNAADQGVRLFNPIMDLFTNPSKLGKSSYWRNEFLVPQETAKYRYKYGHGPNIGEDLANVGYTVFDVVTAGPVGTMAGKQASQYGRKLMSLIK